LDEALVVLLVVALAISCLIVCEASSALAFLNTFRSSVSAGLVGVSVRLEDGWLGMLWLGIVGMIGFEIGCTAGGEVSWLLVNDCLKGEREG
jgi:hypothetical protein